MSKHLHEMVIASEIKRMLGGKIPEAKFSLELWTEEDEKIGATLMLTKIPGRVYATLMAEDGSGVGRTFQLTDTSTLYALWSPLFDWIGHKLKAYNWFFIESPEYANRPIPVMV